MDAGTMSWAQDDVIVCAIAQNQVAEAMHTFYQALHRVNGLMCRVWWIGAVDDDGSWMLLRRDIVQAGFAVGDACVAAGVLR